LSRFVLGYYSVFLAYSWQIYLNESGKYFIRLEKSNPVRLLEKPALFLRSLRVKSSEASGKELIFFRGKILARGNLLWYRFAGKLKKNRCTESSGF